MYLVLCCDFRNVTKGISIQSAIVRSQLGGFVGAKTVYVSIANAGTVDQTGQGLKA